MTTSHSISATDGARAFDTGETNRQAHAFYGAHSKDLSARRVEASSRCELTSHS